MSIKRNINNIYNSIKINIYTLFGKKIKKNRNNIILNKLENNKFTKKRTILKINIFDFSKLKLNGNNIIYLYLGIILLFIIIILYIVLGPLFKIKNIEIIKQDNLTNMVIAYKAVEKYRGNSIFSAEKKDILKNLYDYQNNIKDIKVNLVLPNTIKINIDSYKGLYNTNVNEKTYIITENGTLIPSNYSEELQELELKDNFDKNKFFDYKKIIGLKYIEKIKEVSKSLEENIISLKIKKLTYYITEREIHIEIDQNTTIIFDLEMDLKEQIEKIVIFNKEFLELNKNTIIYIDLRIKNKIFYCTIENEYSCINNIKSIYSKE